MAANEPAAGNTGLPSIDSALARRIVEDSIRRYFDKRRARIPEFVDKTFSFKGATALHGHALGHDLWRAPLNIVMAGPQLGLNLAADLPGPQGAAARGPVPEIARTLLPHLGGRCNRAGGARRPSGTAL